MGVCASVCVCGGGGLLRLAGTGHDTRVGGVTFLPASSSLPPCSGGGVKGRTRGGQAEGGSRVFSTWRTPDT